MMFQLFSTASVVTMMLATAPSASAQRQRGGRPGGMGGKDIGDLLDKFPSKPSRPNNGGGRPNNGGGMGLGDLLDKLPDGMQDLFAGFLDGGRPDKDSISDIMSSLNPCSELSEDACGLEDECVYCMKNATAGVCKYDGSMMDLLGDIVGENVERMNIKGFGSSMKRRGGCCGVAKTVDACQANDGVSDDEECVWWVKSSSIEATVFNGDVGFEDVSDTKEYCSKLSCRMINDETACETRECEWNADRERCGNINCYKKGEEDCANAGLGNGETCYWDTSGRRDLCKPTTSDD